mmetsp:Transcript_15014/g.22918  ORF Transcript_15014/g.22918 Transcript_15014/m.22918 type:complete len:422 (-) Transcript_15014:3241-4506(-)
MDTECSGIGKGCYAWWTYVLMPFIAGIVGYLTNVVALEMTFGPLEFRGIKLFRLPNEPWGIIGWQGIIPTKARKMASICFDLMTNRLFNIKEVFSQLDPARFAAEMEDGLLLVLDKVIADVAMEYMPKVWSSLPEDVKTDVVITTDSETEAFLTQFMRDMQAHIDDVIDIKDMTVEACVKNKQLVVKIFQECGDKEFTFIRRSGFYFGFAFGCFQTLIWFFYNESWVLPFAGFLVGWVTNYLALKVIFRPLRPQVIIPGLWTLQGIFLKRQAQVSQTFARIICVEILHMKAIWDAIFEGPRSGNFFALLRAHTLVFLEELLAEISTVAITAMGSARYNEMKERMAQKILEELPNIIDQSYEYSQEALKMEEIISTKMEALPPEEFESVLHPAFQEDEMTLIMLGGILGLLVGVLQLFTMFS